MKTHILAVSGLAFALILTSTKLEASSPTVSVLQKQAAQAKTDYQQAKQQAGAAVADGPAKVQWQQAETAFENQMAAKTPDAGKIEAAFEKVDMVESRVMDSSTQAKLAHLRQLWVDAQARWRQASRKSTSDDSAQATQPENRTQNGGNFSIRSQRDSENHPPLPSSQ